MPIRYMAGEYNRASGTREAFAGLSLALEREGYPAIVVRDGDREPEDQLEIWYQRMTLTPGTRRVYGTARWQGKTWYRIHPDKVGVPLTSNHEKRRSSDLAAPYNNRRTAAHKRAQQLAPRFGITWEGANFNEDWHWTFWGPLGKISAPTTSGAGTVTPPTPKPTPIPEPEDLPLEDLMAFKSVAIGYRPKEDVDKLESVALDWEDGARLDLHNTEEKYTKSFSEGVTEGGLKILTKGHFDYVLAQFAEHQKTLRERELALARASAGS
ncbi:hypothetical protein [Streptomyces sp. AC495_CC817]|uniref:hypothetical protein n=1 Tax=Streptomyces sp. AC495_CC817 TaxID=2823900 RepID=UPI001C27536B|nr:hypothetical protein [Streptomyces sp. AC495_CC817]